MASAKLERLMNLVAALLRTPVPISAATIRQRLGAYPDDDEAFHRQFSRDKADLREMGITIRIEPVPDSAPPVEGYRIDPSEYYLDDPELDPDELAALHLATRLVMVPDSVAIREGLFKLGGAIGAVPDAPPLVDLPDDPNLAVVFDALSEHRSISFRYHGTDREVTPGGLGFQQGRWYVSGWDEGAEGQRTYRLDRVEGPVRLGQPAELAHADARALEPIRPWTVGDAERFTARLSVAPSALAAVLADTGEEVVVGREPDGRTRCAVEVTNRQGFRSWILGFGDDVEVTGPADVRAEIIDWLHRVVATT